MSLWFLVPVSAVLPYVFFAVRSWIHNQPNTNCNRRNVFPGMGIGITMIRNLSSLKVALWIHRDFLNTIIQFVAWELWRIRWQTQDTTRT